MTAHHAPAQLLLATRNQNKRRELEPIFAELMPSDWQLLDLSQWPEELPDVIEDRDTFEGNAMKKALETSLLTQMSVISEDSGLVVDALDGAPGIYSARFSGEGATTERNNALLVERMRQAPDRPRTARFYAVMAMALAQDAIGHWILARLGTSFDQLPQGEPTSPFTPGLVQERALLWWDGAFEGLIVDEPQGQNGFGYDPHFFLPEHGLTVAQLEPALKNRISHRAKALQSLRERLA